VIVTKINEFGQPIGPEIGGWVPPEFPPRRTIRGQHVNLVPLESELHGRELFAAYRDAPDSLWTYMTIGPFSSETALAHAIDVLVGYPDWQPYAIVVEGVARGFLSYLRIDPPHGVLEIGSIVFAPELQRTKEATEALYVSIKNAFDLGYRRCEWKCDDLNGPSRISAERLGFRYEGTFRKATHYKGRNRDTAWYAITDDEWASLDRAFQAWLADDNFDRNGKQRQPLSTFRTAAA
jgi:RimJ/RimL family protein N-acetyltransferase